MITNGQKRIKLAEIAQTKILAKKRRINISGKVMYWDKEIETLERSALRDLQERKFKETLRIAASTPFYRKHFAEHRINVDSIQRLEQLREIPFTTKNDLRQSYPMGMVSKDQDEIVRLHASSGTTGKSTVIFYTQKDIDEWASLVARSMMATGTQRRDVFQNMMGYGLFTGGLGLHYGAERLGCLVIPSSTGNTLKQLQMMQDFHSTVIHITPSYSLHLHEIMEEQKINLKNLSLKKAYLGAEPYSEETRIKIEKLYNIDAYNSYGLSEMNGPGVAFECVEKKGMHLWEDFYIPEIIDPESGEVLPDGEEGELVITHLNREAMPIIRYRTRDLTRIIPEPCACGRTHRRIERIKGRTDDMLIIGGVNVFPSQIESVLMNFPEVGNNYQIILERKENLDKMIIRVEIYSKLFQGDIVTLKQLEKRLREQLHAIIIINPKIELLEPGSLPPSMGKAVRVIDNRVI